MSDLIDAELAKMERLLRVAKPDLDLGDYMHMARELLAEVRHPRGLVEPATTTVQRQVAVLRAENERLEADLAKAHESSRNLLDWQREAERLQKEVMRLRRERKSLRR